MIFGLNYSLLLAVLVGFSVLIPYIGAFVVTIPVVGVALFQFGLGTEFWSCFAVYLIIQGLDGNLLVPVLFSEAVNLHPLVIILSVVIFGGLWGFWGVFFAIPLATLIKAVVHAWPDVPAVEEVVLPGGAAPPDTHYQALSFSQFNTTSWWLLVLKSSNTCSTLPSAPIRKLMR